MSNQVLLEEAAVASVLHKSLVHLELNFQCYDNIYQHPQHFHCHNQHYFNHHQNTLLVIVIVIIIFIKSRLLIKHSPLMTAAEEFG